MLSRSRATLVVVGLAGVLAAAYVLGLFEGEDAELPGEPRSPPPALGAGPAKGDSPARQGSDTPVAVAPERDTDASLVVRDGWGHPRPAVALRLTPPEQRQAAVQVVSDDAGMLDISALPDEPAGGVVISAVDRNLIVLTRTWAAAQALGHVLVSARDRLTGVVRLVGVSEEDSPKLLGTVKFTILPLPELAYSNKDDQIRVNRALARRGLFEHAVSADEMSLDLKSGRFQLDAYGTPGARLLVSLQGWTSSAYSIEEAAGHGGDIGEVTLARLPSVTIRIEADEGVKVPRSLSTTTWRSGLIGDSARADALAYSMSERGGMWQMINPLRGTWAVGRSASVKVSANGGAIVVPPGFRNQLGARDLEPDVLPRQRRTDKGEIVFELRRAGHEPDVQIICHGDAVSGGSLTIVEVDDPAQINRRISLDEKGRVLREHFRAGKTYGLDLASLRLKCGPKPEGTRFLRWRAGTREIRIDELSTKVPKIR